MIRSLMTSAWHWGVNLTLNKKILYLKASKRPWQAGTSCFQIMFSINIIEGDRNCVKSQTLRTPTEILWTLIFSNKMSEWIFFTFQANCILIMNDLKATCSSLSGSLQISALFHSPLSPGLQYTILLQFCPTVYINSTE